MNPLRFSTRKVRVSVGEALFLSVLSTSLIAGTTLLANSAQAKGETKKAQRRVVKVAAKKKVQFIPPSSPSPSSSPTATPPPSPSASPSASPSPTPTPSPSTSPSPTPTPTPTPTPSPTPSPKGHVVLKGEDDEQYLLRTGQSYTICAVPYDENVTPNAPLSGKTIEFTVDDNTLLNLSAASAVSDANAQAMITVSGKNKTGTAIVTATWKEGTTTVGSATLTFSLEDAVGTSEDAPVDASWKFTNYCNIKYKINTTKYSTAITGGITAWNATNRVKFVAAGPTDTPDVTYAEVRNPMITSYGDTTKSPTSEAKAVTINDYIFDGNPKHATVPSDHPAYASAGRLVPATGAHETGHTFGLDHTAQKKKNVMSSGGWKRFVEGVTGPEAGDVNGAKDAYPTACP